MLCCRDRMVVVLGLLLGSFRASADEGATQGEGLPAGALARIGSTRWWHGTPVLEIAFSQDAKTVASLGSDGRIIIWESASGKLLRRLQVAVNRPIGLPAGARIASTPLTGR